MSRSEVCGSILGGLELFGELFLILIEPPRLVAHLGHFLRESVGRALAQLFTQVIELPAGSGPFGEGLRYPPLLECLGGLTDVLAAFVDLLPCVGHAVSILFALHPFAQLVGIAQDLLLLISEPLELSLDFLACRLRLGGLEGRLQLFEPIIHVVLPLRELAQSIEDLARFALFLFSLRQPFLLGSGRALIFVAVFLVGELELLELPLRAVAARVSAALPLLPRVAANDLKFACTQLEQSLIGRLFGGQGRVEACHRRLLGHFSQVLFRIFHRARRLFQVGFRCRVLQTLGELGRLLDRRFLRLFQHLGVFGELVGRFGDRSRGGSASRCR